MSTTMFNILQAHRRQLGSLFFFNLIFKCNNMALSFFVIWFFEKGKKLEVREHETLQSAMKANNLIPLS